MKADQQVARLGVRVHETSGSNGTSAYQVGVEAERITLLYISALGYEAYPYGDWVDYIREIEQDNRIATRKDLGVDIVFYDESNQTVAVQVKYRSDSNIRKEDVQSFIAALNTKYFHKGVLVVNTPLSEESRQLIELSEKPIAVWYLSDIKSYLEDNKKSQKSVDKTKKELRYYQEEAIRRILDYYASGGERCKLIMAPGTGKTITALRLAERYAADRSNTFVLFLAPSIALLDQTIRNWTRDTEANLLKYAVVSDKTVGTAEEVDYITVEDFIKNASYLRVKPTTSPAELYNSVFFEDGAITVIFSTYQSISTIEEAQKMGLPAFDLIICDEAHKTAGVSAKDNITEFRKVHDNNIIRGGKRLYMTATPRVIDRNIKDRLLDNEVLLYSMDNEKIFGPTIYEYVFSKAVEDGYLAPYKIINYYIEERIADDFRSRITDILNQGGITYDNASKLYCLVRLIANGYLDEKGREKTIRMRKGVIFVSRIREAASIKKSWERIKEKIADRFPHFDLNKIVIKDISGEMSAQKRKGLLSWLGDENTDEVRILVNAKVLTEGIDVPALDFVSFFKPKESIVDIVQATGRVMRKAAGKTHGHIVIPVILDPTRNIDEQLMNNSYGTILAVVDALRSIDTSLLDKIRMKQPVIEHSFDKDSFQGEEYSEDSQTGSVQTNRRNIKAFTEQSLFNYILDKVNAAVYRTVYVGPKYLKFIASNISDIVADLEKHVRINLENNEEVRQKFTEFVRQVQEAMGKRITEEDVLVMFIQYTVTKPVFKAIIGEINDAVGVMMDRLSDIFSDYIKENYSRLNVIYSELLKRIEAIEVPSEKQELLRRVYDHLFRETFSDLKKQLGIAYTPVEVVDFMIRISNELLLKHFSVGISNKGVPIWEPYAGTGTFIVRALHHMEKDKIIEKIKNKEIWGTEITALPYYISKTNVEMTIRELTRQNVPFNTMILADSLELMNRQYADYEPPKLDLIPEELTEFARNLQSIKPVLVVTNPPYLRGVKGTYTGLDKRVEETYAEEAKSRNLHALSSLYDTFILSLRGLSDKVGEGVITMIVNNNWITNRTGYGIRKKLEKEFAEIYIVDMRGNVRKRDKAEGENIFGDAAQVGICIVFLVKKKQKEGTAKIYYASVPDGYKRKNKLEWLGNHNNLGAIEWRLLDTSEKGNWFNNKSEFNEMILCYPFSVYKDAIFKYKTFGVLTGLDIVLYSHKKENSKDMTVIKKLFLDKYIHFHNINRIANSRGAGRLYTDKNNMFLIISSNTPNFFSMFSKKYIDLHLAGNSTLAIPFYLIEQADGLFDNGEGRSSNINPQYLNLFRKNYGEDITHEDIFYYVGAMLMHPEYAEKFRDELERTAPRIPLVDSREKFLAIAQVGREIAEVQTNYENLEPYPLKVHISQEDYTIRKMKLDEKKGIIYYNSYITIYDIPAEAFEWKIQGKSVYKHIVNNYMVKEVVDKKTGQKFIDDINEIFETKNKDYVVELIKKVTTLALKMRELTQRLRELYSF